MSEWILNLKWSSIGTTEISQIRLYVEHFHNKSIRNFMLLFWSTDQQSVVNSFSSVNVQTKPGRIIQTAVTQLVTSLLTSSEHQSHCRLSNMWTAAPTAPTVFRHVPAQQQEVNIRLTLTPAGQLPSLQPACCRSSHLSSPSLLHSFLMMSSCHMRPITIKH